MATSPPPPYPIPPEQSPVVYTIQHTTTQPEDPDLKTHIHPHTLLISITRKDAQILPTVLHYWNHDSAIAIVTKLTEAQLHYIRGFEEVGTFPPPIEGVCDSLALHRYFVSLVEGKGNREAVDDAISQLRGGGGGGGGGGSDTTSCRNRGKVDFRIFVITVFGVESEDLLRGGLAPVWKWAKPESVYYPRTGFWEAEVESVLADAEWMAGRGLQLLVQGVSEERKQKLRRAKSKSMGIV
ncbi:hypothetical protein BDV38DRAFT_274426 [Aspergillus pseudotamarii]|uniref:Uncharacterized protein n=1 Tax=Aspergillus pseudotamarii TaxID=132259 RepID=A0A5N6SJR9_ASPPS|nr:uncharacterized protein BDV38DRAFT_274426 [Aspergillus pseudotamarii]KAE8133344.1 hypothetical protein BDV38DRAFT_274426 [Aspergillus pseudotamarii]